MGNDILHPASVPEIVCKAVRLERSEKPGHALSSSLKMWRKFRQTQNLLPRIDIAARWMILVIERTFALLRSAKRPVILAGNGCIRRRASAELRRFCEKTGIGVINTFMANGCVEMDADYCLYTIGHRPEMWWPVLWMRPIW